MSAAAMMKRITEASPRFKARMAGVFFLLTMLTAASTELVVRGRLSFAADLEAGIVEISSMVAVTLLLYAIFKPVNMESFFARGGLQPRALTFETLQFQPRGRRYWPGISRIYWL
ncbi:MAG: hypothetical protein ABSF15_25410 [Candidatus Sulfotelmatobacter sp.]|jgi:hypothetical protein